MEVVQQGPPKRNSQFQDAEEKDWNFQPRYALAFSQPDIPVRPKLFKYRMGGQNQKTGAYEFSSIELNNVPNLYVDYNMGMRINLVDRGIYSLESSDTNASLQDLRQTLLGKRDEFILSDKDSTAFMQHMDQINDEHT